MSNARNHSDFDKVDDIMRAEVEVHELDEDGLDSIVGGDNPYELPPLPDVAPNYPGF
jgi:hypothetical protein